MILEATARAIQLGTVESTVAVERFRRVEQTHPSITADRRRLSIGGGGDGSGALPGGWVWRIGIGALARDTAIGERGAVSTPLLAASATFACGPVGAARPGICLSSMP